MITPEHLGRIVAAYGEQHPEEQELTAELQTGLERAQGDPADRKTLPGHFTASALVISRDCRRILAVHHALLKAWIQPGGHLEPDETTVQACAERECLEETGVQVIEPVFPGSNDVPFFVDSHPIPGNTKKHEPPHQHYDLRYAYYADDTLPLRAEDGGAIIDVAWLPIDSHMLDESARRSAQKLLHLLSHDTV